MHTTPSKYSVLTHQSYVKNTNVGCGMFSMRALVRIATNIPNTMYYTPRIHQSKSNNERTMELSRL